jgi:hypothetical protein
MPTSRGATHGIDLLLSLLDAVLSQVSNPFTDCCFQYVNRMGFADSNQGHTFWLSPCDLRSLIDPISHCGESGTQLSGYSVE